MSAPAGFGKTTLVSQWLQDEEVLASWISLNSQDDSFRRFTSLVFHALASRVDRGNEAVEHLVDNNNFAEVVDALLSLLQRTHDPSVIVIDDCHVITDQHIHDLLSYPLDYLPQNHHLVLISRSDPPLPLARMRVKGELEEIRADDLRFTLPKRLPSTGRHKSLI